MRPAGLEPATPDLEGGARPLLKPSHRDAKADLFDYIEVFYNQQRRHPSAGRVSPAAFEDERLRQRG